MLGTEFNRHHQQPPGKLGKVDTLILVTVSGEQAQGRSLLLLGEGGWGPTPHWAQPRLAGAMVMGPVENKPGCFSQASQLRAPEGRLEEQQDHRGGWGTTEVTRHLPRLPFPPARPAEGSSLCK